MTRMRAVLLAILPLTLSCAGFNAARAQAPTSPRQTMLLDAGWRFQLEAHPQLQNGVAVTEWMFKADDSSAPAAAQDVATYSSPDFSGNGWQLMHPGQDTFQGRVGFAWYRAVLPAGAAPRGTLVRYLQFDGVDDNAVVWLNGQQLMAHEGWNDPFQVPLNAAWRANGPNILLVRAQNTAGPGGITAPVTLGLNEPSAPTEIARPDYDDASWRRVHLPHDYVIEGTFSQQADTGHGSLPVGSAWYRKTFTLPATDRGKTVWLDFDGVFRNSTVYLNGREIGRHANGYSPFRLDISSAARFGGINTLALHVDARQAEGWWYEGGGIYRHVWLHVASPLHVAPWGVFVTSQLPEPSNGVVAPAQVTIKTTLRNDSSSPAPGAVTLISRVLDSAGHVVASATTPVSVPPLGNRDYTQTVTVARPSLWSIETPTLYRVATTLARGTGNAQIVDTDSTDFGIRTLRFDAEQGFFLNGKPVKILGTCNHQDFAGVGIGMPDSVLWWRIRQLKAMGSNAYRTSHNPVARELLDACDHLGMIVMDETRHLGDTQSGKTPPGTPASDLSDLRAMVERDRNHPSVIMWSMANEEPLQGSDEGGRIFSAMKRVVDELDGTRPVTSAMNGGWGQGFTLVEDLQGINYAPGAYDGFHRDFPRLPLFSSETASTVSTRGIYANDTQRGYVSAYDLNAPGWAQTAENAWQPILTRPFVMGGFVWTGFDYKGEPTPYGWPCVNSHFGVLDLCGFPKDNYWWYKAWWGTAPVVHILPHWNWAGRTEPVSVWVHSNAARVELFLNGQSLGTKDMARYSHLEWSVPYAPGTLEARGYDADGHLIASDRVETAGAPAALKLSTDRVSLKADGEDVTMVEVQVVDAQGRVVPTADNAVSFTVTGPGRLAGVGNGDPSSHEPDQAPGRHAFNGLCMAIVGANEQPGDITLRAASPGLRPASLQLRVTQ